MLASPEEAYTSYLEHVVAESCVDPIVVRATLRQLGYDDATVAVMMGEAEAPLSSFSSSSSSAATKESSKSVSSVCSSANEAAAAAHSPLLPSSSLSSSLPSEMSRPPMHSAEHARQRATEAAAPMAATPPSGQPPSIMHGSKPVTRTPTCASSSVTSASSAATRNTEDSESLPTREDRSRVGGIGVAHELRAPEAHQSTRSSVSRITRHSLSEEDAASHSSPSHPRSSRSVGATSSPRSIRLEFTAGEREMLHEWMNEYNALLLSSAMPRRAVGSGFGKSVRHVPSEGPFDECHHVQHTEASSVCTADATGESGFEDLLRGLEEPQPFFPLHRGKDSDLSSPSFSSGGFSEEANSPTSSASSSPPENARDKRRCRDCVAERPNRMYAYRTEERASARRQASSHLAEGPSAPFRCAVPKAESPAFVPTSLWRSPRRGSAAADVRCMLAGGTCRTPYREAQDVRIVRATHALAGEAGCSGSVRGVSQSHAREQDAARQAQHTSRAEPENGRRIPVMQPPARPAVRPLSGLACRKLPSTLPHSAVTDRVSLAQYYRRQWEKQERRITVASRDAVWDARYALLSCTAAPRST